MLKTTVAKLDQLLADVWKASRHSKKNLMPVMVYGPPGVGKTEKIFDLAKGFEVEEYDGGKKVNPDVFAFSLSTVFPTDIGGVMFVKPSEEKLVLSDPPLLPPRNHPRPCIIFIDEYPVAPKLCQQACLQLMKDGKINTYSVPPGSLMIAAGNRKEDKTGVEEMGKASQNRFIHIEVSNPFEEWKDWAWDADIHESIIGFLGFKNEAMNTFAASLKSHEVAFATPRTWEYASDIIHATGNNSHPLIEGCVGSGVYASFRAFVKVRDRVPSIKDLLLKGTIPNLKENELDLIWATLTSCLGELRKKLDVKMCRHFFKFLLTLPPAMAAVGIVDIHRMDALKPHLTDVAQTPEFLQLVEAHGDKMK